MTQKLHHFPQGFGVDGAVLTVGGTRLNDLARAIGQTPFFVYDRRLIAARIADTRAALPRDLKLHYAMKANPMPALVHFVSSLTDGLDVASGGELACALGLGIDPARISFAGPGKTDAELALAITAGATLNLESEREADRAGRIARALGKQALVAVRVNPSFETRGAGMRMGGRAQPFGVDAERVPALLRTLAGADFHFRGFHIYAGSQNLNADLVIEAQSQTIEMVLALAAHAPHPPEEVNLGGGFGIPYFPGDLPLDVTRVGQALATRLQQAQKRLPNTRFVLELGRYLVGEAGLYVTRVIDRKQSYGETFLVTDGGLHHQLAASGNFGQVLRRNYPVAVATRMDAPADDLVTVTGCLCTPLDRLADKMLLAKAEPGDLIVIYQAGAYGLTASPTGFLSHPVASQHLI